MLVSRVHRRVVEGSGEGSIIPHNMKFFSTISSFVKLPKSHVEAKDITVYIRSWQLNLEPT